MNKMKVIVLSVLFAVIILMLSGCGESDSAKLSRLEREAVQKRQAANEAQDAYRQLKDFTDKYGN